LLFLLVRLVGGFRAGSASLGGRLGNVLLDGGGGVGLALLRFLRLLGGAHRALDARFRIEDRFLNLLGVGIELGRDGRAEVVHAEERRKRLVDVGFDLALHRLDDAEITTDGAVAAVLARSEHLAGGIEHGDVVGVETGNGRGDEVANRCGGLAASLASGADHHRGRRFLRAAAEIADIGHDDMDAGGVDAVDRLDGAADLAFQGAHAGHFLHEGGEAERADIVEEFVAGIGAVGQAAFGEQKAGLAGRAGGDAQALAIGSDFEINAGFGKRDADLVEIVRLKAHIQGLVGRLVDVHGGKKNDRHRRDANTDQCDQPCLPQGGKVFKHLN